MISKDNKFYLNRMNSVSSKVQLGTQLRNCRGVVRATLDVSNANQGGAVGDINLLDEDGNAVVLPSGAIIVKALVDIVTAFVSAGGAGTVAFKAQSAGDILAAVDADTLSARVTGVPTGAGATGVVKLTADRTLKATVAVEALTAGKAHVFVEYVLAD